MGSDNRSINTKSMNTINTKNIIKNNDIKNDKNNVNIPTSLHSICPSSQILSYDAAIDDKQHCPSSTSCIALHRIIEALLYYDDILSKQQNDKNDVNNEWITYFNYKNYKHLLNDYHHILTAHLDQKNINETNKEFELIHDQIIK